MYSFLLTTESFVDSIKGMLHFCCCVFGDEIGAWLSLVILVPGMAAAMARRSALARMRRCSCEQRKDLHESPCCNDHVHQQQWQHLRAHGICKRFG